MHYEEDLGFEKVNFNTWKKILKIVFSDKKSILLLFMFVILMGIIDVSMTLINKYAIDVFFEKREYQTFVPFVFVSIGLAICFGFLIWGFIYQASKIEVMVNYKLRKEAFETLQKLPFSYFDKTPQGWVMARMTSDSRRLANIISWGLIDVVWSVAFMVVILVILFVFNWQLALIILVSLPIMFIIAYFFRRKILEGFRKSRKINSAVTAAFNESFMGAKTTKSLAIEYEMQTEFRRKTDDLKRSTIKAIIWSAAFTPAILIISYLVLGVVMYQGAKMVLFGSSIILSISTFYLFVDFTVRFFDPIMNVAESLSRFQQAQASAERVVQLIEEKPAINDSESVIAKYGDLLNPKYENWESLKGDIEFRDVSFYYNENELVLKNFNLTIKAGQTVALVGHTGSGKTTIINLLARFYEPTSGMILIDGIDYKNRSIHWLHKRLGYVLQTPHLFSGTVIDNIGYGNLEATFEQVKEATEAIGAAEFIEKLKDSYNTDIGEGGNKLSIGQKQLISFARAILADPKILLLDEATSSIDSYAEQIIQKATKRILKDRTSIVVAHRLSTIAEADLIVVLEEGEILEKGTHKQLIELRGKYFQLYKNQFMEEKTSQLQLKL